MTAGAHHGGHAERRRPTAEHVARALGKARRTGKQWTARCPAHDDQDPGLSIANADDGRLLVRCHAGCDQSRVIDALRDRGLWPETVDAPSPRQRKSGNGHAGEIDWQPIVPPPPGAPRPSEQQLRCDMLQRVPRRGGSPAVLCPPDRGNRRQPKQFVPQTYGRLYGKLGWHNKAPDAPKPLYRLNALSHAAPHAIVLLCEGEKKADAVQRMFPDYVGMSWMGGAKADGHADLTPHHLA